MAPHGEDKPCTAGAERGCVCYLAKFVFFFKETCPGRTAILVGFFFRANKNRNNSKKHKLHPA